MKEHCKIEDVKIALNKLNSRLKAITGEDLTPSMKLTIFEIPAFDIEDVKLQKFSTEALLKEVLTRINAT